jgi:hypothetical protein
LLNLLAFSGFNLALSAIVAAGTNFVGFAITTVTKTHKITDLVVRPGTCLSQFFLSCRLMGFCNTADALFAMEGCSQLAVATYELISNV